MTTWIITADGSATLLDPNTGETYHSRSGARSEAVGVFLQPTLAHDDFSQKKVWRVLDVGFGLGGNWLVFTEAAKIYGKILEIVSLESDPEVLSWKDLPPGYVADVSAEEFGKLRQNLMAQHHVQAPFLSSKLILGDARESVVTLAKTHAEFFDAILHDPFSSQRAPELWSLDFFKNLATLAAPNAILTTYSVARSVRENLSAAGFLVSKKTGVGAKRERLEAVKLAPMSPDSLLPFS